VVGAPQKNSYTGAVYVFIRSGTSWTQQAELHPSDSAAGDEFGCSLSLDGNLAVVGACNKDDARGAAYVFFGSGAKWTQQSKVTASGAAAGDAFGISVSLSKNTMAVGEQSQKAGGAFDYANLVPPATSSSAVIQGS
jgi:hypothetical protein